LGIKKALEIQGLFSLNKCDYTLALALAFAVAFPEVLIEAGLLHSAFLPSQPSFLPSLCSQFLLSAIAVLLLQQDLVSVVLVVLLLQQDLVSVALAVLDLQQAFTGASCAGTSVCAVANKVKPITNIPNKIIFFII
jgi:hypothetical protein